MRWRSRARLVFYSSLLLLAEPSIAEPLYFSRNARTYETQQASITVKAMAHACLTQLKLPDSLPCNPAWTPFGQKPRLAAAALLSNGYDTIDKLRRLIDSEVNDELVSSLFSGNRVIQVEANTSLQFISKFLNTQYTPFTAKLFSVVRNEALPSTDLFAVQETNLTFQSGIRIIKGLYAGAQVRYFEQKIIRKRFRLTSLATQAGRDALKPKTQKAIVVEPGIGYLFAGSWRPKISAMIVNTGFFAERASELPMPTDFQGAIGISPPVPFGGLELEVAYRRLNFEEEWDQAIHGGVRYSLGSMNLMAGLDFDGVSSGLFFNLEQIGAGVMYSTTRVPWRSDDFYAQTVYVQVGWQI